MRSNVMQPGHSAENALELVDSEDEQLAIVVELPHASGKAGEVAPCAVHNSVQALHGFPSADGAAEPASSSRALAYEASSSALRLVQAAKASQVRKLERPKKIASDHSPASAAQRRTRRSYFGPEADKSSFRTSKATRSGVSLNRCEWRKTEGDIFEPAELCNKTFASGEALACHVLTTHSQDVNESNGKVSCRWGSCRNRAYLPSAMRGHALKHLAHVAFCCPFTTCRLNAQSSPTTAKDQALHIERAHSKASVDQLRPFATVAPRPLHSMRQLVSKDAALLQQMPRDKLGQWQHDSVVLLAERFAQVKLGQASRTPRRARAQLVPSQTLLAAAPSESEAIDEDEGEQDEVDSWSTTIAGLDSREPRAEPVRVPQLGLRASMEDFVICVYRPKSGVSSDLRQHHRLVQEESISELTLDAAAVMDPKRWLRNAGQSVSHADSRFHELARPAGAQEASDCFEGDTTSTTSSSSIAPRRSHGSLDGAPQSAASAAFPSPTSSPLAPMQLLRAPRSVQLAYAANAKKRKGAFSRLPEGDDDDSDDESVKSGVVLAGNSSIVHRKRKRRIVCSSDDDNA